MTDTEATERLLAEQARLLPRLVQLLDAIACWAGIPAPVSQGDPSAGWPFGTEPPIAAAAPTGPSIGFGAGEAAKAPAPSPVPTPAQRPFSAPSAPDIKGETIVGPNSAPVRRASLRRSARAPEPSKPFHATPNPRSTEAAARAWPPSATPEARAGGFPGGPSVSADRHASDAMPLRPAAAVLHQPLPRRSTGAVVERRFDELSSRAESDFGGAWPAPRLRVVGDADRAIGDDAVPRPSRRPPQTIVPDPVQIDPFVARETPAAVDAFPDSVLEERMADVLERAAREAGIDLT